MQDQAMSSMAANSLPSSSERSSSSALHAEVKEGMESDDEIRRVPEFGGEAAGPTASAATAFLLLRNRVSAQQARERKKAYLIDLEARVKELETKNAELEERLSTLQNENQMLRQMIVQ
ncbi:hypothetical protein DH2020_046521 [Rehmannia glutinosa]|uniref:BZIP domain-containing protein n=1 Tax=Rehmannia glutinosa TaxID=99300 RepID=A0ABR0UB04_REHGL